MGKRWKKNPLSSLWRTRKYRYGITRDDALSLLAKQGGVCPLCGIDLEHMKENEWHIDHCHTKLRVRGILCGPCNKNLGVIEKVGAVWMSNANAYIEATNRNMTPYACKNLEYM